jgi:hypothetical protein
MKTNKRKYAYPLIIIMLLQIVLPGFSYALSGGPSQPEFQSFAPIGTTEMVNLPDGDFTYNIPLLDVGGYPINISYNSGITQDQEATIVGLGWNINPGVINRNVRALPDDFNGEKDAVTKEFNMRENITAGFSARTSLELFGKELKNPIGNISNVSGALGMNLGFFINNYSGLGYEFGVSPSFSAGSKSELDLTVGLGLGINSKNGANFSPSLSLSGITKRKNAVALSISAGVNSREGLTDLSLGYDAPDGSTKKALLNKLITYMGEGSVDFSFAAQTFVPNISMPQRSSSFTFNLKPGTASFGNNFTPLAYSGYISSQKLRNNRVVKNPYGLLYAERGYDDVNSLMDFNREKDGAFYDYAINLPLVNPGYDVLSVTGQGIGGSYQLKRGDVPMFFDSKNVSESVGGSLGYEAGGGNLFHQGFDVKLNYTRSVSKKWVKGNEFLKAYDFSNSSKTGFERAYYKAGEMGIESDDKFYEQLGEDKAVRAKLDGATPFNVKSTMDLVGGKYVSPSQGVRRDKRDRRNQVISYLTASEASQYGLQKKIRSYKMNEFLNPVITDLNRIDANLGKQGHHISQIESIRSDGLRYVYGIPAYNLSKDEVTFNAAGRSVDCATGNVIYDPGNDDSKNNKLGSDYYFNKVSTPAYAHSYLLTAVLGQDYEDMGTNGPSPDDMGTYTLFNYTNTTYNTTSRKIDPVHWRVPFQKNAANHSPGFFSKTSDDKGHYIHGTKEQYLLHSIESKTMGAEFHYSDRQDYFPAADMHGGKATMNKNVKLDKIVLYSKPDRKENQGNAIPIKTVHFEYNYELCPGTINSNAANQGKLTLKKIYFTYGYSQKGKLSPYEFEYKNYGASYARKAYDRWGNYMPGNINNDCDNPIPSISAISNDEFPYADQNPGTANTNAGTWSLNKIELPSGGIINVEYEAKHYAYVQDKKAMEMVTIKSTNGPTVGGSSNPSDVLYDAGSNSPYTKLYLNIPPGTNIRDYAKSIKDKNDYVYLKCYTNLSSNKWEYISLYAKIKSYGRDSKGSYIDLETLPISDKPSAQAIHPISKYAFQFIRENLPKIAYGQTSVKAKDVKLNPLRFFAPLVSMGLQLIQFVGGYNKVCKVRGLANRIAIDGRSYVRLITPDGFKYGGGALVKKVTIDDNWGNMTGTTSASFSYGQEYDYTTTDPATGKSISSGVASYEPMIGGDENPFRMPVEISEERKWAVDNVHYVEKPFGESMMPGPRIVYSEIKVRNLQRTNVQRTATGHSIMKYYTAKDFPVKFKQTKLEKNPHRIKPIFQLLKVKMKEHMTASQGFVIETNNMHGQAEAKEVYDANGTLISSVEYKYKTKPDGSLDNEVDVMLLNGKKGKRTLGIDYSLAGDSRHSSSLTLSGGLELNIDGFIVPFPLPPGFIPIVSPSLHPSFKANRKQYRSISLTKQIKKFGILDQVIASDLGSTIATSNEVWDAETGEVLLTKTYNEFEDPIYNMKIPAYLAYEGMRGAYQNIGASSDLQNRGNGKYKVGDANYFFPGDELALIPIATVGKAWVLHSNTLTDEIFIIDQQGNAITNLAPLSRAKVIRSGYRNMPSASIGSITSKENPFETGLFNPLTSTEVLNASAVEYNDEWQTFCDEDQENCFPTGVVNPFVRNLRGNWKAKKSWVYLTERNRTPLAVASSSTNIRKNGTYSKFSLTPGISAYFWQKNANLWNKNTVGWEWTTEVTKYNPNGTELENKDRLGRYAAEIVGYYNQLVTGVAANSKYHQIAFDGFEDYKYNSYLDVGNCKPPRHFGKENLLGKITDKTRHTGKYALMVMPGDKEVTSYKTYDLCSTPSTNLDMQPFILGDCDCIPVFAPEPGKYVVTAWVKEDDGLGAVDYKNHKLRINTLGATSTATNEFHAKGNIIEGWQRIEGQFEIRNQDQSIEVVFESSGNQLVFFDDLRIFPFDGDMKNFVYDDISLKLLSEIDANGYANFYEYDLSGELIRIKKETARGIMTIQESRSGQPKK